MARFPHLRMGTVVELILQSCSDWKFMSYKYRLWRKYYDSFYALAIKSDFNFLNSEWQLVIFMLKELVFKNIFKYYHLKKPLYFLKLNIIF